MAQETRNVDYESMVEKYMNEWDGCNLREFCFSEKVNIYRMLKTMKKMGVKKEPVSLISEEGRVKGEETGYGNFAYRNLIAYQKGKEVVMQTYRLLKKFPCEEQYALCDQLRRASTSITSNIAEGMTRHSSKDRSHFLEISYGSLMEVSSQMDVACDLGYITSEELKETDSLVDETARLISGLQRSCSERVKSERVKSEEGREGCLKKE